jgi:hypothetical protein
MSRHLEEEKLTAIEMVERVETSAEVAEFKDAHQAAVAAALVPVGGVYLTPEEMKMVRRDHTDTSGKS